jgi:ribosomal protein S18 acetylase RimI-like enzyme
VPAIELRPARADDFEAIVRLWHRSASLPGVGSSPMPPIDDLRQRLKANLAQGMSLVVAEHEGALAGFAALDSAQGELSELFVDPAMLGRGIGQALLADAKRKMPQGFALMTRASNGGARRFYAREGLVETHTGTHPRSGDPVVYLAWRPA